MSTDTVLKSEMHVHYVFNVGLQIADAVSGDGSRLASKEVKQDRYVVRGETPHHVYVSPHDPEVEPLCVDIVGVANFPAVEQLFQRAHGVVVKEDVTNHEDSSELLGNPAQLLCLRDRRSKGLLDETVLPRLQDLFDHGKVRARVGCYSNRTGLGIVEDPAVVLDRDDAAEVFFDLSAAFPGHFRDELYPNVTMREEIPQEIWSPIPASDLRERHHVCSFSGPAVPASPESRCGCRHSTFAKAPSYTCSTCLATRSESCRRPSVLRARSPTSRRLSADEIKPINASLIPARSSGSRTIPISPVTVADERPAPGRVTTTGRPASAASNAVRPTPLRPLPNRQREMSKAPYTALRSRR